MSLLTICCVQLRKVQLLLKKCVTYIQLIDIDVFLVSYYHIKTLILKWPLDKSEETSGNCIAVRRAK